MPYSKGLRFVAVLAVIITAFSCLPGIAFAEKQISHLNFEITLNGEWKYNAKNTYCFTNAEDGTLFVDCQFYKRDEETKTDDDIIRLFEKTFGKNESDDQTEKRYLGFSYQKAEMFSIPVVEMVVTVARPNMTQYIYCFTFLSDKTFVNVIFISKDIERSIEEMAGMIADVRDTSRVSSEKQAPAATSAPSTTNTEGFTRFFDTEIKYSGASIRRSGGKYILDLKFLWHNLSDEPTFFLLNFQVETYQDGIQLQEIMFNPIATNDDVKIMKGAEIEVTQSFYLRNLTSKITVIVDSLYDFSDKWPDLKFALTLNSK